MDAAQVFTIAQAALNTLLMVAAPVLLVALVVGIAVSIFQAATSINEATLTFVPKLLAVIAVMGLAGPWMITTLVEYLRSVLLSLPTAVG
jgi:flagellar biosynthetic protein FliQ